MPRIDFCDLARQDEEILPEIMEQFKGICRSGQFSAGRHVKQFEELFAAYCGAKHCVGVNSGTSALHLALRSLDVGPGDEIITVPLTFVATVWAICYVGARPVFVDVEPVSRTMNWRLLESVITPRCKAIIPVHLYGQPAALSEICDIAGKHGLAVIEDAAQAHGATFRGKKVGTLGRLGCFSFYPTKNLGAYGEAGAIVTEDEELADRIQVLHDHAQREKYHHEEQGYNYRMDEIQAMVISTKLSHLDLLNSTRRAIAARYRTNLHELADEFLEIPEENTFSSCVYHLFVVLTPLRDRLRQWLANHDVATGLHYPVPIHLQPFMGSRFSRGDYPVAERIAESCLSLPLHPNMQNQDIDHVCSLVREFFLSTL